MVPRPTKLKDPGPDLGVTSCSIRYRTVRSGEKNLKKGEDYMWEWWTAYSYGYQMSSTFGRRKSAQTSRYLKF